NGKVGVFLFTERGANFVKGNIIGLDRTGTADNRDKLANKVGVEILSSPNNVVGGNTADDRNIISGNLEAGVFLSSTKSKGNKIQGNYIGTDVTGAQKRPNQTGVVLQLD